MHDDQLLEQLPSLQFPEKLIPLMVYNTLRGKPLPLYSYGLNIRDWLFVTDHCEALRQVLQKGALGETYNIGGECQNNESRGGSQYLCDSFRFAPRPLTASAGCIST